MGGCESSGLYTHLADQVHCQGKHLVIARGLDREARLTNAQSEMMAQENFELIIPTHISGCYKRRSLPLRHAGRCAPSSRAFERNSPGRIPLVKLLKRRNGEIPSYQLLAFLIDLFYVGLTNLQQISNIRSNQSADWICLRRISLLIVGMLLVPWR